MEHWGSRKQPTRPLSTCSHQPQQKQVQTMQVCICGQLCFGGQPQGDRVRVGWVRLLAHCET